MKTLFHLVRITQSNKAIVMKKRIIVAVILAFSLGSWVNTPDLVPEKTKQCKAKTAPAPLVKKPSKKGVKLLFESILYHFM